MEPNHNLPKPTPNVPIVNGVQETIPSGEVAGAETTHLNPETVSNPSAQIPVIQPAMSQSTDDVATTSVPVQNSNYQAHQATNLPQVADDVDLIEKEWVDKAKLIVSQTRNDPYNQNKEINKIKSEYIKKRYNKNIGISES